MEKLSYQTRQGDLSSDCFNMRIPSTSVIDTPVNSDFLLNPRSSLSSSSLNHRLLNPSFIASNSLLSQSQNVQLNVEDTYICSAFSPRCFVIQKVILVNFVQNEEMRYTDYFLRVTCQVTSRCIVIDKIIRDNLCTARTLSPYGQQRDWQREWVFESKRYQENASSKHPLSALVSLKMSSSSRSPVLCNNRMLTIGIFRTC